MVTEAPLRAMVKEGKAANGSFGEGEATTDFRKRGFGVGLSRDCVSLVSARLFFGRPGDQRVPSFPPNRRGGVCDVTVSGMTTDGDSIC
jgi:hypothetical protein